MSTELLIGLFLIVVVAGILMARNKVNNYDVDEDDKDLADSCEEDCSNTEDCECVDKAYEIAKDKFPLADKLEREKQAAIKECDGCENEVFVLKLSGEDIGYYKNLNQLSKKNDFPNTSVYRYWSNKENLNQGEKPGLLFNKYEVTKLS